MEKHCIVKNCHQLKKKPGELITLHNFPMDEHDRAAWNEFVSDSNLGYYNSFSKRWMPKKSSRLCSRHFQPCCFYEHGRFRTIKAGHHPSIKIDIQGNSTYLPHEHNTSLVNLVPDSVEMPLAIRDSRELDLPSEESQLVKKLKDEIESLNMLITSLKKQIDVKSVTIKHNKVLILNYKKLMKRSQKSKRSQLPKMTQPYQTDYAGIKGSALDITMYEIIQRRSLSRNTSYSKVIREFAMQLHYYSPKAYDFIRKHFENLLPNPRSFSFWTSGIQTKPGFFPDVLRYLQNQDQTHQIFYAISLDEIHIRQQIIYDGKKMAGYTDYGDLCTNKKSNVPATSALFIMATQINGKLRIPIGYVLTNGCDTYLFAIVVVRMLQIMNSVKARVLTLTFDGLASNLAAAEVLGCKFTDDSSETIPYMKSSVTDERIYFIPDPCHMVKLMRNMLESNKCIIDNAGNKIKWEYFRQLAQLQHDEELRMANKVTSRHVNFKKQKMKVKLAVQLLSSSSAVSLNVCEVIGLDQFRGSAGTAEFARICDRVFDLLNSRPRGTGFKAPVASWNLNICKSVIDKTIPYLLGLKVETFCEKTRQFKLVPIYKTRKFTCIQGLVIALTSVKLIIEDIIQPGDSSLKYLPTYKLSQDMVELFFSALRQRFGRNNNPNVLQLESALKRILSVKITPSYNGNCIEQEEIPIAQISPFRSIGNSTAEDTEEPDNQIVVPDTFELSKFSYIAGFVAKSVMKHCDCIYCIYALIGDSNSDSTREDFQLLSRKNNGGLFIPSADLVQTCRETEMCLRCQAPLGNSKITSENVVNLAVKNIVRRQLFSELRQVNSKEHPQFGDHVLQFIEKIVKTYTKLWLHHLAKEETLRLNPESIRNQFTKLVLFKGN